MRVISKRTLLTFGVEHPDAVNPLAAWYAEAAKAQWPTPQEIKSHYKNASFLAGNRVVFNIGGNKYRLIVKINYPCGMVYLQCLGIHTEYDKIHAEER
jgi:mRNA interferase HigB